MKRAIRSDMDDNPKSAKTRGQWRQTPEAAETPVSRIFKSYALELDAVNDRFERLVKLSRDITIGSKRVIFLLHRVHDVGSDRSDVLEQAHAALVPIRQNFGRIAEEIHGHDYFRYQRAFSPGMQEYLEAAAFLEYIEFDQLLTREKAEHELHQASPQDKRITITLNDYLLGVADLTGELMRLAVQTVSGGDRQTCLRICVFMRHIYDAFAALPDAHARELPKKIDVMNQSLKKVEAVCFNVRVRGSEYQGMLADLGSDQNAPNE